MNKKACFILSLLISVFCFAQPNLILREQIDFGGNGDWIYAAIPANDGFYVTGKKGVWNGVNYYVPYSKVCKYDSNSDLVWEITGPEGTYSGWQSLALAPNGVFMSEGWDTAYVSKLDNQGNVIWKKNLGTEANPILVSNDNYLVVLLSKYSTCPVIIFDLEGNELNSWNVQLDLSFGTILDGNELYILGNNPGGIQTNVHSEVIKTDLTGNIFWTDTLMDVHGLRGAIDINNDLYVSGRYLSNNLSWYKTIKYNLNGSRIWEKLYDGDLVASYNQGNHVKSVIAHPNGGCVVAGSLVKIGGGDPNMLDGGAISYDPEGDTYFKIRYDDNPLWYRTLHQASLFSNDNYMFLFGSTWNLDTDTAQVLFMTKWDNVVGVEDENYSLPENFLLFQNYPNPFNPFTTIKYQIPEYSYVTLKVYDVLGKEISTLVNEEVVVGSYEVEFDGSELTSGIYFYKLQAGNFVETRKMVLLK